MLSWLLEFFRAQPVARAIRPDRQAFDRVLLAFPALDPLDPEERTALYERSVEILESKEFHGAGGFEPEPRDCLAVALLAALPVIRLGLDWYGDFHTFILYPAAFMADIEEVDEDGLVHSGRDLRSGEAWMRGPVVLAMNDVWDSGQGQGFNVVVHELAHQIDQRNGEANGFPPLHADMDAATWTSAFAAGYQQLQADLDKHREPTIDPYGAESPAEFFAVACEFFFDAPDWLAEHHPDIHAQLGRFFRIESRLASA